MNVQIVIKLRVRKYVSIAFKAFRQWREHDSSLRASALAFLAVFILPSLLYIVASLFELIYGKTEALNHVVDQINTVVGPTLAGLVRQLLGVSRDPFVSLVSLIFSVVFTIAGLVAIFQILHEALNSIWGYRFMRRKRLVQRISDNIGAFFLISALGLLLVLWTSITSVLVGTFSPTTITSILLRVANVVFMFFLATALFAAVYKLLPDIRIRWVDVKAASILTAAMYIIGSQIFSAYIYFFGTVSFLGSAGALMMLIIWIYVMAQFLLYGAEFSRAYFENRGVD
jgi:YihY family inner membrane protein